jgi:hypothetical protein
MKWLTDNKEKRNKNGDILSGSVPKEIVSGIQNFFDWRDKAEHENKMLNSTYFGLFTTVAQIISFFSETDIPEEIMDICNRKKQKIT